MKLSVKNKATSETLFIGTKQECMHFIKRRQLNRQEICIESFDTDAEPVYNTTIQEPDNPGFFKRVFGR